MKISFFDLETQYLFQEVGGRSNISKLKIAVAGTFCNGQHKFFEESQANDLFEELNKADLIVGYNLIRFDYPVLEPYLGREKIDLLKSKTFDIMLELGSLGVPWISLNELCKLNNIQTKIEDTMKIPKMWREGKYKEVREYLLNDLKITESIFNHCKKTGQINTTFGNVNINW